MDCRFIALLFLLLLGTFVIDGGRVRGRNRGRGVSMVQQMLHGHTPERTKEALRAPHFSNRRYREKIKHFQLFLGNVS